MKNLKMTRSLALLVSCGTAPLWATRAGAATTLFDSGGFEPTAGYIQDTYLYDEPGTGVGTPGVGQFTGSPYAANAYAAVYNYDEIFNGNTNALNTQLADIVTSGNTSTAAYYPILNDVTPNANTQTGQVAIVFQEAIGSSNSGSSFTGVVAYATTSGGVPADPVGEVGLDTAAGTLIGTSSSFTAAPDTFYNFELLLDYTTDQYSVFEAPIGGSFTQLGTAEPFLTAGATTFNTAALETYETSGASSGQVFFDNFSISEVPEPATASLLMGGVALLATRRRRASVQVLA